MNAFEGAGPALDGLREEEDLRSRTCLRAAELSGRSLEPAHRIMSSTAERAQQAWSWSDSLGGKPTAPGCQGGKFELKGLGQDPGDAE